MKLYSEWRLVHRWPSWILNNAHDSYLGAHSSSFILQHAFLKFYSFDILGHNSTTDNPIVILTDCAWYVMRSCLKTCACTSFAICITEINFIQNSRNFEKEKGLYQQGSKIIFNTMRLILAAPIPFSLTTVIAHIISFWYSRDFKAEWRWHGRWFHINIRELHPIRTVLLAHRISISEAKISKSIHAIFMIFW